MVEYLQVRRRLVTSHSWLKFFDDSLEDKIRVALQPVAANIPRYDCFDVEDLLKDVSQSLDRCLVYQREYNELEATAIKIAIDYDLFKTSLVTNKSLEQADWIEKQRTVENAAQQKAADAFAKSPKDALAPGFGAISKGSADSTNLAIGGEKTRKGFISDKWQQLSDYQETLESRHTTPGHPLNFAERAGKAAAFLIDDLAEAFEKCRCIEKGAAIVYGVVENPFPDITQPGILDNVVLWVRKIMRSIELTQFEEIEFEHIVPGRQPAFDHGGGQSHKIISEQDWGTAIINPQAPGKLSFDVRLSFTDVGSFTNLRMKGIGLSMSYNSPANALGRLWRMSGVIFPPELTNEPFNRANFAQRSPIIIENVALTEPQQRVRLYYPAAVTNLDPRGIWVVQVSTTVWLPDSVARPRDGNIFDLKLHFHLVGKPSKASGDWTKFWW